MSRGRIRPTTALEAAERARSMVGYLVDGKHPIRYRLTKYNGGKDPFAPHPAIFAPDTRRWSLDCSGLACWSIGVDRYQPRGADDVKQWLNTDSILELSRLDRGTWFEPTVYPEVGAFVIYGSIWRSGRRTRVGHMGVIVEVPAEFDPGLSPWSSIKVVHCSSSASKRTGHAITETDATLWKRRRGRFVRFKRAA